METDFTKLKAHDNANCSTMIFGKNASATGRVLIGHNEDDNGSFVQVHKMPRMQHKEGEVLTFADGDAVIPQVGETYAYQWSEVRSDPAESFADSYINEWGVAIVTDSCICSRTDPNDPPKAGLGYGLRSLIAERARTAREGVRIAAELVEKYGYISSRSYHICDKDEAWVVQIPIGHRVAARRVGDDEIYYIPNWFTIHQIDFEDTENYYASPDLISYAIKKGFYIPTTADYSDFDFSSVYQGEGSELPTNILRSRQAWGVITGRRFPERRVFSIKAERKYGIEDIKKVLRTHYEGSREEVESGVSPSPHRFSVCNSRTVESLIVEFAEDTDLTVIYRTNLRPCTSPYVPWYLGSAKLPKGYEWIGPKASKVSHFTPDAGEFVLNDEHAFWAFKLLQSLTDFDYHFCESMLTPEIERLEAQYALMKPEIERTYSELKKTSPECARGFLTQYTAAVNQEAWDWAKRMWTEISSAKWKQYEDKWRSEFKFEE